MTQRLKTSAVRPRVVIVGGGFGGIYAARGLARAPIQVTVVDRHNYHLFRPMLYQVATGLLSADEIAAPIRSILRKQKNADVQMSSVIGVDTHNRMVLTTDGQLHYDYLILATGINYNYFGHEEWKNVAPGLESVDEADRIRGKILMAFERAERLAANSSAASEEIKELLRFILVGGGTAGVELAGTIAEMARLTLKGDFRHIDPSAAHIILCEAGNRILPTYPERLSNKADAHLKRLGVDVWTNSKVEQVDSGGAVVNGKRVRSSTVLWSAGVVASPAGRWLNVELDRMGKVKVNANLSVPGHNNIFVIGDTAEVVAHSRNLFGLRTDQPELLPGVAQPAIQEGKYVASVIRRRLLGRKPPAPFWYWDKGNLAIVGRTFAVADLRPFRFSGMVAWSLWIGVHIYFLIGFANRLLVLLQWGISFLTKRRGVRIFPLDRGERAGRQATEPAGTRDLEIACSENERKIMKEGKQMKIAVIGGTGLIGSRLVKWLREHGQEVVAAAPSSGVNTLTGEGLADALKGASVVVDVTNSPSWEDAAVLKFFETSTRNLLNYEAAAGVRHHIALSVVGTDRLLESGFFRAKLVQENLIKASSIPHTIVRATQFYEFVKPIADISTQGNEVRLPPVLFQPMAADDVASAIGAIALSSPVNGILEIGGPERFRMDEPVRELLAEIKDPRDVIADPEARYYGIKVSERTLIPNDDAKLGETRFESWLTQSAVQIPRRKAS